MFLVYLFNGNILKNVCLWRHRGNVNKIFANNKELVKTVSGCLCTIPSDKNRRCRHFPSEQREAITEDNKLSTDVPDILCLGAGRDHKSIFIE